MSIVVATPDGGTAEFPDGTSPDAMRAALRAKFGGGPAKDVARDIVAHGGTATGNVEVQSPLQRTISNIPGSAYNVAKGFVDTEIGAGKALINPNPMAKVSFLKELAVGTYEGLKQRYGKGLGEAIESDPVGVLTDVFSVAAGLRGGLRAGARGKTAAAPINVETAAAQRASAEVTQNLTADNATPAQVKDIGATRPGVAAPMDLGGENTLASVERLANTSQAAPEMRKFLTERQEGQLSRITSDLQSVSGTKRGAVQATKETMEKRAADAKPAYKTAYEAGDREIWSEELQRLTSSPAVQSSMQSAVTLWRDNAIADGYGAMNPASLDRPFTYHDPLTGKDEIRRGTTGGLLKFGKSVPVFPNLQFWDYTKGALDKMIDAEIRPDGTMTRRGRALTSIANQLRSQLDILVPEYKTARDVWAGPSEYLGALRDGRDILTKTESSDEMAANFNALSESSRQGYREAAVSAIINKLESNPTKIADFTRELRSPQMRKKILALLPNDEARQSWTKKLNFEVRSSELAGAGLKNSATARRLAMERNAVDLTDDLVLGVTKAAMSHGYVTQSLRALLNGYSKVRDRMRASTDREMVKILTGRGITKQPPKPTPIRNSLPISGPALGLTSSLSGAAPSQ